jgi:hypothetical protein
MVDWWDPIGAKTVSRMACFGPQAGASIGPSNKLRLIQYSNGFYFCKKGQFEHSSTILPSTLK